MKKLLTLFYISLAVGIILAAAGGVMIDKADVNMGQVYDVLEDNIRIGDKKVTFTAADIPEINASDNYTADKQVSYPLNEFNTLEIYSQHCTVNLAETEADELKITLDHPEKLSNKLFLQTAVKNGSLYVLTNRTDSGTYSKDTVLTVEIPENFKGGYSINTDSCTVNICDIESSMNMSFNLLDTAVKAKTLTAGNITFELGNATFEAENIASRGSIDIKTESSTMKSRGLHSEYARLSSSSSTFKLDGITGGFASDTEMTSLECSFTTVTGNIGVKTKMGSVKLTIPKDSPATLHHEENYSSFNDNVKWAKKGSRYVVDTTAEFSVVQLESSKT